jgi:enediyne biosynthesis protein E4
MRARVAVSGLLALPFVAVAATDGPLFQDVAEASGLVFTHVNGMTGEYYFPEMTGQGGALFDYDGDGDLDVYFVQGGSLDPETVTAGPTGGRLFRNDLALETGGGRRLRFVDVTAASGIRTRGYGMGVAIGDVDGDGWLDLYLTNYGANELWRNQRDGTFRDVTERSATGDPLWSTSASFLDADADGDLDLYVANYVAFDVLANPRCFAASSRRDYCGPSGFPGQPDRLYRNLGDGRFEEVAARLLRDARPQAGLGVLAADLTGDGRVDLYVANDGEPNNLWVQLADGTFVDDGLLAGVAVNREGRAEASMGVDAADFDGDGDEDLFVTHLSGETNTLYVNLGGGLFEDRTLEAGLGPPSLPYTGFGTGWVDLDNDGDLDLVVVNGAVQIQEEQAAGGEPFPLKQKNLLFLNAGSRFAEAGARGGEAFASLEVSRGAAFGDIDGDGDVDVLELNNNAAARLLLSSAERSGGWIGVRDSRPSATNAHSRVVVERSDGRRLYRRGHADGSYGSAGDPGRVAGLGEAGVVGLRIEPLGGVALLWLDPPSLRYLVLPHLGQGSTP